MSSRSDILVDKRILDRNIKRNRITRKEAEQHLSSLEDAAEKSVPIFFDPDDEEPEEAEE